MGFPLVRPLILLVSPPPGLSYPEEFYYDPSSDVIRGSFAAAHAFFVANGHEIETIDCPDFNKFVAAFPGAIVCSIEELPVPIFSQGGQLLLEQAIAGIMSTVGGFAIGGSTVAP
jgi:hypothetical protein